MITDARDEPSDLQGSSRRSQRNGQHAGQPVGRQGPLYKLARAIETRARRRKTGLADSRESAPGASRATNARKDDLGARMGSPVPARYLTIVSFERVAVAQCGALPALTPVGNPGRPAPPENQTRAAAPHQALFVDPGRASGTLGLCGASAY